MNEKRITLPAPPDELAGLRAGDRVLLTGVMYTARDAAHKRLTALLDAGKPLPLQLENAAFYYMGPSPAPAGKVIGSAGPTTSYRMDKYTPRLLEAGLTVMVGKGPRSPEVFAALHKKGAVYLGAIGGAGALLSTSIKEAALIAFEDLGTEAIFRLYVEDFPATVIYDRDGGDLYKNAQSAYRENGQI